MKKTIPIRDLTLTSLFTALIIAGTFIRIPIPVVPFTLQVFFTMLCGLLLGARLGAAAVGAYITLGLLGLPVFTQGGGPGYIFTPTFGYIIGFCAGAFITGSLAHKVSHPSYRRLLAANLAGLGVVYLFGMVYYYLISHFYLNHPIGIGALFLYCFILVIPGDILLCLLAAKIAAILIPLVKRSGTINQLRVIKKEPIAAGTAAVKGGMLAKNEAFSQKEPAVIDSALAKNDTFVKKEPPVMDNALAENTAFYRDEMAVGNE